MRRTAIPALLVVAVVVSVFAVPVAADAGGNSNSTATTTATETTTASTTNSAISETIDRVETRLLNLRINASSEEVRATVEELAARYPRADAEALAPLVIQELRATDERESNPDVEQVTPSGPNVSESGETIDRYTTLVSKRLDDGEAVIRIHSTVDQSILVWDAAAMWAGERPAERQVMVNADETVQIRLPTTSFQGGVLVGLDASEQDTRYPVRFRAINLSFDWLNAMTSPLALFVGAIGAVASFGSAGLWKLYVEGGEPIER